MKTARVRTAEELGKAIKDDAETIEIEGDFRKQVWRIKVTGNVAWAVAIGAIAVAVTAILCAPATGGTSTAAGFVISPLAIGSLGVSGASAAVAIAVAAGGIAGLNKLRKYKIVSNESDKLVLKK